MKVPTEQDDSRTGTTGQSTTAAAHPLPRPSGPGLSELRGVGSLALSSGWRLTRHPLAVVGMLLSAAYFSYLVSEFLGASAAVLHRDISLTAGALLPYAIAIMVTSGTLVFSDEHRGALAELTRAVPADPGRRTLGRLLGLTVPMTGAVVLALGGWLWIARLDSVGLISFAELATGPLIVGAAGAIGVAIVTWVPHPITPTLTGLLGVGLQLGVQSSRNNSTLSWLAFWSSPPNLSIAPELIFRPAARHLVYLVGLILVFGLVALLKHDRGRRVVALALAAAVFCIASAWWLSFPPSGSAREEARALVLSQAKRQDCLTEGSVRACTYPAYSPWARQWATLASAILVPADDALNGRRLPIRQSLSVEAIHGSLVRPSLTDVGRPDAPIQMGTAWVRPGEVTDELVGFVLDVASWAVDMPGSLGAASDQRSCSTANQARAAVAIYLVTRAPGAVSHTIDAYSADEGIIYAGPAAITLREIQYGKLLSREAGIEEKIAAAWTRVLHPSTTPEQLGRLIGVEPPPASKATRASASIVAKDRVCQ